MLIKSKDIAPDSQAAAYIVAEVLGRNPWVQIGEVWVKGKHTEAMQWESTFFQFSPEVVLEVIKHILTQWPDFTTEAYLGKVEVRLDCNHVGVSDSFESAVISCLLMTRDEWEVPGELCGSYMTKSETQD